MNGSKCPYTWFRNLLGASTAGKREPGARAEHLHIRVSKGGEETVRVALPAGSARWLMELIPSDVVTQIRAEGIPLDLMADLLSKSEVLLPQELFALHEPGRQVVVWLE